MLKKEILKYFTSKEKRLILIRNKREYAKVAKILNSAGLKWASGHSYVERGYGLPCFLCNDGTFCHGNWNHLPVYSLKDSRPLFYGLALCPLAAAATCIFSGPVALMVTTLFLLGFLFDLIAA